MQRSKKISSALLLLVFNQQPIVSLFADPTNPVAQSGGRGGTGGEDDDEDGEEWLDPEMGEEDWFLDEAGEAEEQMFEILESRQLNQMLMETVDQLAMQVALTKGEAMLLLRHFKCAAQ